MTESFKRDDGKRRAIKKKEVLAVKKKTNKQKKIVFLRQFWRQLDSTGLMEQFFFFTSASFSEVQLETL